MSYVVHPSVARRPPEMHPAKINKFVIGQRLSLHDPHCTSIVSFVRLNTVEFCSDMLLESELRNDLRIDGP